MTTDELLSEEFEETDKMFCDRENNVKNVREEINMNFEPEIIELPPLNITSEATEVPVCPPPPPGVLVQKPLNVGDCVLVSAEGVKEGWRDAVVDKVSKKRNL